MGTSTDQKGEGAGRVGGTAAIGAGNLPRQAWIAGMHLNLPKRVLGTLPAGTEKNRVATMRPPANGETDLAKFNQRLKGPETDLPDVDHDDIETMMPLLSDREEFVLRQIHGFAPYGESSRPRSTRKAVGADLGVTGRQATNIEKKALRKFRHVLLTNPSPEDLEAYVCELLRRRAAREMAQDGASQIFGNGGVTTHTRTEINERKALAELNKRMKIPSVDVPDIDRDDVETLMPLLDERQEFVLRKIYGFAPYGEPDRRRSTRIKVSEELGVYPAKVAQLERQALWQFRYAITTNPIEDDLAGQVAALVRIRAAQEVAEGHARARRAKSEETHKKRRAIARKKRALWQSWDAFVQRYERLLIQQNGAEEVVAAAAADLRRRQNASWPIRLFIGRKDQIDRAEHNLMEKEAGLANLNHQLVRYKEGRDAAWLAYQKAEGEPYDPEGQ